MAGFEPATSSLPRKCSTPELHGRCLFGSGRRGSNSRPLAWKANALPTELLPHSCETMWAKMDSNHRRHKPADLQSAPFGHSGIRPEFRASCRIRTNDPEITNHVLWPTELKRRVGKLPVSRRYNQLPLLRSRPGGFEGSWPYGTYPCYLQSFVSVIIVCFSIAVAKVRKISISASILRIFS